MPFSNTFGNNPQNQPYVNAGPGGYQQGGYQQGANNYNDSYGQNYQNQQGQQGNYNNNYPTYPPL